MENKVVLKISSHLFDRLEKLRNIVRFKMKVEGYFLPSLYVRQARVHVECQLLL